MKWSLWMCVRCLLDEFAGMFPMGLPPFRDIQHHIDSVSGSSLPNHPNYCKSPKEHGVRRRPCCLKTILGRVLLYAVSALLTLNYDGL